jgi:hypothetical protein
MSKATLRWFDSARHARFTVGVLAPFAAAAPMPAGDCRRAPHARRRAPHARRRARHARRRRGYNSGS